MKKKILNTLIILNININKYHQNINQKKDMILIWTNRLCITHCGEIINYNVTVY